MVMQRLHAEDLAGLLLDRGGWDHRCIPAIAETDPILPIGAGRVHHRKTGDILDPVREPRHVLDQIKEDLGSRTFEAQYQQQPIPDQGGLVTWSWFQTYDGQPQRGQYDTMVVSWDIAMKDHEVNDDSVGIVAMVRGARQVDILDVIRVRLDFPAFRKRIVEEARRHNATTLIEAAGSGIPLIQDLYGQIPIIQRQPLGDKVVRLQAVTPMIEAG
ncbi:MAG: hypothetical protein HXX10_14685 [Rhodoplanes sp.]|uniref:hypothetical protein n=1 Tax=Rhodoplanes sp. TaxID=1968906 RepID=UPI0017E53838|nr:hypothetical protein [Rhodoplanes sp.]NVO15276.1 hypothetical protein [Rhodoplanes sp.]